MLSHDNVEDFTQTFNGKNPDNEVNGADKREGVLTDADIERLHVSLLCHTCKFTPEQLEILRSFSTNVDTAQKIANKFIIYGMVASVITFIVGGTVLAVKNYIIAAVASGNIPGK